MRWLVCLAVIAIAVAGAILGSLAFSAHQQPMPVATADPAWNRGSVSTRLTDQPCDFEELATILENEGIPPAKVYIEQAGDSRRIGCWVLNMDRDVMTLDTARRDGLIPKEWLTRQP